MENIESTTMTVDEWCAIEGCSTQRDTEKHIRTARKNHLMELKLSHLKVACAKLPNGKLVMLDGHSRAMLWERSMLTRPETLFIDIYPCKNQAEIRELYLHFESSFSVESVNDKKDGALRHLGIIPKSRLIKSGGITTSLKSISTRRLAWRFLDMLTVIKPFKKELLLIDEQNYPSVGIPAPALSTLIITVKMYGVDAFPFWDGFINDEGSKTKHSKDGIFAACEIMRIAKETNLLHGGSVSSARILVPKLFWCFEQWSERKRIREYPREFPTFEDVIEASGIVMLEPPEKVKDNA